MIKVISGKELTENYESIKLGKTKYFIPKEETQAFNNEEVRRFREAYRFQKVTAKGYRLMHIKGKSKLEQLTKKWVSGNINFPIMRRTPKERAATIAKNRSIKRKYRYRNHQH